MKRFAVSILMLLSASFCQTKSALLQFDTEVNSKNLSQNILKLDSLTKSKLINFNQKIDTNKKISFIGINSSQDEFRNHRKNNLENLWAIDSISASTLSNTQNITWIKKLPSILIPNNASLDDYLDAAAMLKSNILIIYKINANIYEDVAVFGKNSAMAISNIEIIAIDVLNKSIITSQSSMKKSIFKQNDNETSEDFSTRAKNNVILENLKESIEKIKSSI